MKWAIVLSLVWTQFALAEHNHEHAVHELSHACELCQHFDTGDYGLTDVTPARAVPPASRVAESAGVAIESAEPFRYYCARASP